MFTYNAHLTTSGGALFIKAMEIEGEIHAEYKDKYGTWSKKFFDEQSFFEHVKTLHVYNRNRISYYRS